MRSKLFLVAKPSKIFPSYKNSVTQTKLFAILYVRTVCIDTDVDM